MVLAVLVVAFLFFSVFLDGAAAADICVGTGSSCDQPAWEIPSTFTAFEPLTVTTSDRLIFNWNNIHDVVSLESEEAYNGCSFANGELYDTTVQGPFSYQVIVDDLEPGTYYFACSIGGHCFAGQKIAVTVTSADEGTDISAGEEVTTNSSSIVCVGTPSKCEDGTPAWEIPPTFTAFDALNITTNDTLFFEWEDDHDVVLLESAEAYESCDFDNGGLTNEEIPGSEVSEFFFVNTVTISNLEPGTYYFACSIGGHCFVGQKIIVNVLPPEAS